MATGDPFYCFEHKCYMDLCAKQKHHWETEVSYKARLEFEERNPRAHPDCPSCRCAPAVYR